MQHHPPPSIRITGPQAKKLNGAKPGKKVPITITGRLMEIGIGEYDREPHARIEVAKVRQTKRTKK